MANGVNNQVSRLQNPRFRPKSQYDTRTNANPTGSTTMRSFRPTTPVSIFPQVDLSGVTANMIREQQASSGRPISIFPQVDLSGVTSSMTNEIADKKTAQKAAALSRYRQMQGNRRPASPPMVDVTAPLATADRPAMSPVQSMFGSVVDAARPVMGAAQGLGQRLAPSIMEEAGKRRTIDDMRRQRLAADAEYKDVMAAREQQAVEDSIARAGEYTPARQGQIDQLQRDIARSEAAASMFGSEADRQRDLNERARTMMNLSPAQQANYLANQDYARQYGRRLAGLQGLGQRRAAEAAAGQVSEAQADANYAKLLAGGEEMPGRDGLMVSQVGDRPKVDLSADEAAEQLMRRGDYYAYSPDGTGSSIFSKRRRERIRDESLTKDRYFAPELAESMGLDPSTRFALKEQGEDGLVDTAYAKSAQRQEMLGERTGRLTQDAKAILKAAGVPTAGVRGKKKIEEAWMQYRENMAKEKTQAPKAIGITAATQALNRMKEGKGATEGEQAMFNTLSGLGIAADSSAEDIMNTIHDRAGGQFDFDEQVAIIQHIQNNLAADKKRKGEGIFGENAAWSRGNVGVLGSGELPEAQRKAIESAEGIDTSDPEAVGEWFSGAFESQYAKEEERSESSPQQKPWTPRSGMNRKMFSPPTGY